MAWRSHGHDQASLVDALLRNGLVTPNSAVERALRRVDRGPFCAPGADPYADAPQRTPHAGATISAPHMHAQCLELLAGRVATAAAAAPSSSSSPSAPPPPGRTRQAVRILDVGCGTGYLLAALAHLAVACGAAPEDVEVVGVERLAPLADAARALLLPPPPPPRAAAAAAAAQQQQAPAPLPPLLPAGVRATVVEADGHGGWPAGAPYDVIHVGAAVGGGVPPALLDQLAPRGVLVLPLVDEGGEEGPAGARTQALWLVEKGADGASVARRERVMAVVYVPLVKEEAPARGVKARAASRN